MFHLQAPRHHRGKTARDDAATVGHAISKDLKNWRSIGTALKPGPRGAFDDLAIWTGSAIEYEGMFYHFYTGRSQAEPLMQRIGLATSQDLLSWSKHEGNPILSADGRYYAADLARNALGNPPAWRDPFVFADPNGDGFWMTLTARSVEAEGLYNGCIALAHSDDLKSWTLHPPLLNNHRYDEIEVSQVVVHNGRFYLFFSTAARNYEPGWAEQVGSYTGLHCYVADALTGPYRPVNKYGVVHDSGNTLYAARLLKHEEGSSYMAIGWLNEGARGKFLGRLGQPFTVSIEGERVTASEVKT